MLCQWLYHLTSIDLFDGRLFRAGVAAMLSIILVMTFMPIYIRKLQSLMQLPTSIKMVNPSLPRLWVVCFW